MFNDHRLQALKSQLGFQAFFFQKVFNNVGIAASVLSLLMAPVFISNPDSVVKTVIWALTALCASLLLYIYIFHKKKLHRYAQATYFSHYVNHTIRDILQSDLGRNEKLRETTKDLLTAIAYCFSVVTGVKCRACILELHSNFELTVEARDSFSSSNAKDSQRKKERPNLLSENTDFEDLWFAENGCQRYFLSNDLPDLWNKGAYKNSSFEYYGKPDRIRLLGFNKTINWRLPYKSCLILPIRYISAFTPPPRESKEYTQPHWLYWGFLCIDSNKTNVFDERYSPELGGAFADALYTLFSEMDQWVELATRPAAANPPQEKR